MSDTRDMTEWETALRVAAIAPQTGMVPVRGSALLSVAAEITRLRAALAAQVPQWLPIESAPKDGTLFLCWVSAVRYGETDEGQQYQQDASQVDFCSWRDGPSDLPGHGYFDPCCGQIADSQDATHWMPLPAAPGASPPPAAVPDAVALRAQALEEAAKLCDVTPPYPFRPSIEAAHAIRKLAASPQPPQPQGREGRG